MSAKPKLALSVQYADARLKEALANAGGSTDGEKK